MSGGSFNYLCFKDAGDLLHTGHEDLEDMAEALKELGYAEDVAEETLDILKDLQDTAKRLNTRLDAMSEIWRGMEWWHSGDRGEDQFKRKLEKYRAKEKNG